MFSPKVCLPENNEVRPGVSPSHRSAHSLSSTTRTGAQHSNRKEQMRKFTFIGWVVFMLSLAAFWNLPAQEVVAHIRGTVTDPSGAGVPDAEVKATNTQTRVSNTVPSQGDGSYE